MNYDTIVKTLKTNINNPNWSDIDKLHAFVWLQTIVAAHMANSEMFYNDFYFLSFPVTANAIMFLSKNGFITEDYVDISLNYEGDCRIVVAYALLDGVGIPVISVIAPAKHAFNTDEVKEDLDEIIDIWNDQFIKNMHVVE